MAIRGNEISTLENWLIGINQNLAKLQVSLTEIKEILENIEFARRDEIASAQEEAKRAQEYGDTHGD